MVPEKWGIGKKLLSDWAQENDKMPADYTYSSNSKVLWKCSEDHLFSATIGNRVGNKTTCPCCAGKATLRREAVTRDQMRKFLKFVHDDVVYCKYYEVVYILFHTGMRISEFCGLTIKDIDLENRTLNIDHQLLRLGVEYIADITKTEAGRRKIPITEEVAIMFRAILEDREPPRIEPVIGGYSGFLFYDENGMPLVAMHWQHRFNHVVKRYNDIYRVQMP